MISPPVHGRRHDVVPIVSKMHTNQMHFVPFKREPVVIAAVCAHHVALQQDDPPVVDVQRVAANGHLLHQVHPHPRICMTCCMIWMPSMPNMINTATAGSPVTWTSLTSVGTSSVC